MNHQKIENLIESKLPEKINGYSRRVIQMNTTAYIAYAKDMTFISEIKKKPLAEIKSLYKIAICPTLEEAFKEMKKQLFID